MASCQSSGSTPYYRVIAVFDGDSIVYRQNAALLESFFPYSDHKLPILQMLRMTDGFVYLPITNATTFGMYVFIVVALTPHMKNAELQNHNCSVTM